VSVFKRFDTPFRFELVMQWKTEQALGFLNAEVPRVCIFLAFLQLCLGLNTVQTMWYTNTYKYPRTCDCLSRPKFFVFLFIHTF